MSSGVADKEEINLEEFLQVNTKKGKWEDVVVEYKNNPELAQSLKVTVGGDTALHLAVIDDQEEIVEKMVKYIGKDVKQKKELLEGSTNERKNNPLHLAAVMGSVRMCHAIASAHPGLVDMRNRVNETPLFLAAVYGNKDAFFCLYYFCDPSKIAANCRLGKDGDTVLHRAISNEQFDLAFQLIHINKDSINWVNEDGFTPLHVLASKPTSFKTGSNIKGWRNIVYYCTFVHQLKPQTIETIYKGLMLSMDIPKTTPNSRFPLNYHTCIRFFTTIKHLFLMVIGKEENNNQEVKKDKDLEKNYEEEEGKGEVYKGLKEIEGKLMVGKDEPLSTKFPSNYSTCIDFFQFFFSAIMIVLGFGSGEIRKIRKKKEKHTWSIQVMEKLIESASPEKYDHNGGTPMGSRYQSNGEEESPNTVPYNLQDDKVQFSDAVYQQTDRLETPNVTVKATETVMLTAARNGAIDIVRGLFQRFPLAIRETNSDKKNVVLLAAEFRQPEVYKFLLQNQKLIQNLFRAVDHNGNSALHLAATAIDPKLWLISGAAFQMQWEVKWYKYVKESMPLHLFSRYNNKGEKAREIFLETHMDLVAKGGDWLYKTSESCSLVATLIATVAFATAATVPGGNDDKGEAKLKSEQGFFIFSISSLIALCLSSTSMIMFLAILTSRFEANNFGKVLPWKLLIGLSCLYFSIIAMLVSFCSGHYFLIIPRLHNDAVFLYTIIFLPVALIFGIVQLPLYFDLLQAIHKTVPKRSAAVACA